MTLTANAGHISGYVVVLDERGEPERQGEVKGTNGKASIRFDSLTIGNKRVGFISFYGHTPSSGNTSIADGSQSELVLSLRDANSIRGLVVDASFQPLEGAHVTLETDAFLVSSKTGKPIPILETSRGFFGGVAGSTTQSHNSYAFFSDGSSRRGGFSDKTGRFTIDGLSGTAFSIVATFQKTRVSLACAVGRETTIILPIHREDLTSAQRSFEEFSNTFARLMQQLAANPNAEKAYLDELRGVLYRMIEDSTLSPGEKEKLKKHADEACDGEATIRKGIPK